MNRVAKSNPVYSATIIKTGEKIKVYKLKNPTDEKIWVRYGGGIEVSCKTTYSAKEVKVGKEVEE